MQRGPVIEVEGARQLRATLKRAGQDLGELSATHAEIARLVASVAASRAPKLTGRLAGSIRGSGAKTVATVRAGGASLPYAGPIHYGWAAHSISPNPFLTEPAHDTEPIWTRIYEVRVNAILTKVKGI